MSTHKTTLDLGQLFRSVLMDKRYLARRITRCCTTDNPSTKVALRQRNAHMNRHQILDRGKVYPIVTDLHGDKQLPQVHSNRPYF